MRWDMRLQEGVWHEMGCDIRKGCGMRWGVTSDGV